MFAKLFAGYRAVFTFALVAPEHAAKPVVTIASLLSDVRFTWRKLSTVARKTGMTVEAVKAAVIAAGGKVSRNGLLVKAGTTAPVVESVTGPDYSDMRGGNDFDDDAEEDDYIEDEDESELDEESDLDEEFDAATVTILRDKLNSPNYRWRKLPTLAQSAGLSESETRGYLDHIGATESRRGGLFRN